jgi:hypothetical protein
MVNLNRVLTLMSLKQQFQEVIAMQQLMVDLLPQAE